MRPQAERRRGTAAACLVLIVALFGGAIAAVRSASTVAPPAQTMATAGDPAPISLDSVTPTVAALYRHAADHEHAYRGVPCYCGCESFADHRDLLDCFVRADGAGYDSHAAGCAICQAEAREVQRLLGTGHSRDQLRNRIIDQFGPTTAPRGSAGT